MKRSHRLLPAAAALAAAACGGGAPSDAAPPPMPHVTPIDAHTSAARPIDDEPPTPRPPKGAGETDSETFEGTAGLTDKPRPGAKTAVLRDARAARHAHYDRVVFEFEGDGLPGYHVAYIDKPVRQCGSGDAVAIDGQGWLSVRMTPAAAHTEAGKPTVPFRERKITLGVIEELERTCDFEGEVTWVLGVSSPNPYRVLELASPPRLVVDVKADARPSER